MIKCKITEHINIERMIKMAFKDKGKELSYIAQYQKDNYDRITVMAPKGTKDQIKSAADLKSVSVSAFVLECVQKELERMKS